jgi:hypothetical protein
MPPASEAIGDQEGIVTILTTLVEDRPAAFSGEPTQLFMRVHRDRLVGPFERRPVGDMVGIETHMAVCALEA